MNSRSLISLAAISLALASQTVSADSWKQGRNDRARDQGRMQDYARVVHVEPLVQRQRYSVPVEQCWSESRYDERYTPVRNSTGAAVVGGAAGALLGSQFGHGDGRAAATVAGAALGALIGHQAARNTDAGYYSEPRAREIERCRVSQEVRYEERVVAYRVTYVYRGRELTTEMPHDPGSRIRVGVDVHPLY